jgi:hypothetical protein
MTTTTKVRLMATSRQKYAGRALHAGDEFDAESEQDALDLEAANMARRVEGGEPDRVKRAYHRRDMKAQDT